jgi:hypothetical protein
MLAGGFKDYWTQRFRQQAGDYQHLVSSWDPYVRWSTNSKPDATAEDDLILGLRVAFGNAPAEMVAHFLRRAIQVADRAIGEGKFESELCEGLYPANLGRAIRTKAFCSSILENRTDVEAFREASRKLLEWCKRETDWDAVASNFYLSGISCALLGSDWETAQALLHAGQAPEHKSYVGVLGALIDVEKSKGKLPAREEKLLEKWFNKVRDPAYNQEPPFNAVIGPFQVACLHYKYVLSGDLGINWERAIEQYAA